MIIDTAKLSARAGALVKLIVTHERTISAAEVVRVTADCKGRIAFKVDTDPRHEIDVSVDPLRCS